MGNLDKTSEHPVFQNHVHLSSGPSFTFLKSSSSFILIKTLKSRCLLFNLSIEETQGEGGETTYSRSPSLSAAELGWAHQTSHPFGTGENPKRTCSCLQCIKIKCLQIRNHRAIIQNISPSQGLVRGVEPVTQKHGKDWGSHQQARNQPGVRGMDKGESKGGRKGSQQEACLL